MILRWIRPDTRSKKTIAAALQSALPSAPPAPYAVTHAAHLRQRSITASGSSIDDMGESEFNAILEQVCDTVMPRMAAKKLSANRHNALAESSRSGQDIPWSTLFLKLGEETAVSLHDALAQLQDIALLHPNVAPAIANVTDRLEHARRAAMIAQQFTQLRGSRDLQMSEMMSLRQVVSDAITRRARWLHRRKVKARLGLLDAQIMSHPASLNTLVEELINWAGGIAQDIGFAVREPTQEHHGAQLLVMARVNTASLEPDHWQNVGWFLWHQLAKSLGARAELQVTQEALSVTMDFAATPVASSLHPSATSVGMVDSSLDTDMSTIIAGCRALLIISKTQVQEQAHRAVNRLGLRVVTCASVAQARELMCLQDGASQQPLPHAIVYEGSIAFSLMLELRQELQRRHPERKMAFVELSEHVGSDFHVSQMGDASTAHVSLAAISKSLAPALVFELCKVI